MGGYLKIWSYQFSTRIDGKGELIEKANKYFETLEVHGFAPLSIQTYAFVLMTFFRWIKNDWQKFENFDQKKLQDWMFELSEKNYQPNSINQRLVCVRSFFQFCFGNKIPDAPGVIYRKGYVKYRRAGYLGLGVVAPKARLEMHVRVPKKIMDPISPKDVDMFLADINRYRDLALTLVMLLCGLRRQEVTLLKLSDIDFTQHHLLVNGKGSKQRVVPMTHHLMEIFEKYLSIERPTSSGDYFFVILQGKKSGQAMTNSGIRSLFRQRRERLGIPKAKPHQFRHAFASDLARAGVPLTTIQKLLGHADPQTSLIYIKLYLDDIKIELNIAMKKIEERYAALSKQTTSRNS